jgi:predicted DNA-binding protein
MRQTPAPRSAPRPKTNRSGVPITFYLDETLNQRLNTTSKERHVGKSSIIRLAVERLLTQLESGQLELPLGI